MARLGQYNLEDMTEQEVCIEHLFEQGRPSRNQDGMCVYRRANED